MADDWVPVAEARAADDWKPVGEAPPPAPAADTPFTLEGPADQTFFASMMPTEASSAARIAAAFGAEFKDAYGPEVLPGLSPESVKELRDAKILAHPDNPLRAWNNIWINDAAALAKLPFNLGGALFRGTQAAVAQAGEELGQPQLGRDLAAMPEAFFGSPSPLGIPKAEAVPGARGLPDLAQARELGVIGPERPPIPDTARPAEAARALVPDAADTAGGKPPGGGEPPGGAGPGRPPEATGNPWRDRFDQFVGKLETTEDVKTLIREAADANNEFPAARRGDLSLAHVDTVAQVTGVPVEELPQGALGRALRNDDQVRVYVQTMLDLTQKVTDAAADLRGTKSEANRIALQEALMRRDKAVEAVVGLRAEWGRTGNVFQEFQKSIKEEQGFSQFLKDNGRTPTDLDRIADLAGTLGKDQLPGFLHDMRKPTLWDKAIWYWVNALISGPVTHAKYVIANAAYGVYEAGVVTPLAGAIGKARELAGGGAERVFVGEGPARLMGLILGTPDAIVAGWKAAKTGLQTPLPGEVAQGIVPRQNKNVAFQQKPIDGVLGSVLGAPSRGASAIHSFFNFLGYRAEIEAQAYRAAAKEGLKPTDDAFWRRQADLRAAPGEEAMNAAIENGYKLTFITELSPGPKAFQTAINKSQVGRLVMPFVHIPFNILKAALEGTPGALVFEDARADLMGKNGAVKRDTAVARIVAGSAVGAWAANAVLNDRMTGYGPTDQKERAQWLATGHQPYSIRIGDYWISYNRFGPLGTMLGLQANLSEALPHVKADGEELTKAVAMVVHGWGRLLEDEVGMQGLAGLLEAINEPERKGTRFVSSFAGSWLPYSSMLRQTASFMDPFQRDTKTVIDGLRYQIPGVRGDLYPKRNWLGEPILNPGYKAAVRMGTATPDRLGVEMGRLDLRPAPPEDRIGSVKLPQRLNDEYQATAGVFTRQGLEMLMDQPGWDKLPAVVQQEAFKAMIKGGRDAARTRLQMTHPEIIQQGVDDQVNRINGAKKTKLQ